MPAVRSSSSREHSKQHSVPPAGIHSSRKPEPMLLSPFLSSILFFLIPHGQVSYVNTFVHPPHSTVLQKILEVQYWCLSQSFYVTPAGKGESLKKETPVNSPSLTVLCPCRRFSHSAVSITPTLRITLRNTTHRLQLWTNTPHISISVRQVIKQ